MSRRREFSTAVRVAAVKRANGLCEAPGCGAVLIPGRWQLDHVNPDGLTGEPTLANAQCLCEACWRDKNPKDASAIAQAKRREAAALGARPAPKRAIQSAPFPKSGKRAAHPMAGLPRRALYVGVD